MSIYSRLDNVENDEQLKSFRNELADRFGKIPRQVEELFNGIRLRWLAKDLGFERIIFKGNKLRCYFVENTESVFYESRYFENLMQYIGAKKSPAKLKQTDRHLILIFEDVRTMNHAKTLLQKIYDDVIATQAAVVSI
jgi:transcription-repair coupling factor (superfamily II helicase)